MAITKRILKLFKADIHGIIDCLEEPETMLRQAIRDMEEEIAEGDAELARLNEQEECRERAKKHSAELRAETERQIELCFDAGNEALARTFVRRKLECEQRLKLIVQREASLTAEKADLEKKLHAQREKLASVKEKMEIFCKVQPSTCDTKQRSDDFFVSEEQIEVAMLEERRRRQTQAEGRRAAQ